MNNRHRLYTRLCKERNARVIKKVNNALFNSPTIPILSVVSPKLPNEKYAFSLRGAKV